MENLELGLEEASNMLELALNDDSDVSPAGRSPVIDVEREAITDAPPVILEEQLVPNAEGVGDVSEMGLVGMGSNASSVENSRYNRRSNGVYVPPPLIVRPFLRSNYHLSTIDLTVSTSLITEIMYYFLTGIRGPSYADSWLQVLSV